MKVPGSQVERKGIGQKHSVLRHHHALPSYRNRSALPGLLEHAG